MGGLHKHSCPWASTTVNPGLHPTWHLQVKKRVRFYHNAKPYLTDNPWRVEYSLLYISKSNQSIFDIKVIIKSPLKHIVVHNNIVVGLLCTKATFFNLHATSIFYPKG